MNIPSLIVHGDSVTWRDKPTTDNLGNAIDSSWTLTWYFSGPTAFNVVSTAYGDGWETSITATQTAAMASATSRDPNYWWQARASKGGKVITIGKGQLRVDPDLAGAGAGYDGRTPAEIALANIQATIKARIGGGAIAEYWIGHRRLRNEPIAELLKLESRYKMIVARERRAAQIANGNGDPRNTYVRFG